MSKPPLPNTYGPRLPYFNAGGDREPSVEFLSVIGSGLHGHVVKAKIDGQIYAVKIFKFTDDMIFFLQYGDDQNVAPPKSQIEAQCHPFYRECRAFARLKEVGKEHLAVKCYGYLEFDAVMEQALADQLDLVDWERDPEYCPEWENQPLRAIVKEFLPPAEFSRQDAPKMIRELREIHRCGIVVSDIKYDAYVGRQLVDFSFAVTTPHIQFDKRFKFNDSDPATPWEDLGELQDAFRQWNYFHPSDRKITVHTCYGLEYSLRSRKEPYQPQDFNWKACADQWTKLPRRSGRKRRLEWGQKKRKKVKRLLEPTPWQMSVEESPHDPEWESVVFKGVNAMLKEQSDTDPNLPWDDLEPTEFLDDPPIVVPDGIYDSS